MSNRDAQSGRRGDCPPASHTTGPAGPRPAVPGSPDGQSSHSFSATVVAAQGSANRLHRPGNQTTDGRVLPAKFGPSRVVSPSGSSPGSLLSVLRPRLTPASRRRPLLVAAPTVADGVGLQVSLSKNVNFRGTAGPFISGTEHRASLCGASLPVPST